MKKHIENIVHIVYNESKGVLHVMALGQFSTLLLLGKLNWNIICEKHLKN